MPYIIRPPRTKCRKCGRPVCRAWTTERNQVLLQPNPRKFGEMTCVDRVDGKVIVTRRQQTLFGLAPDEWGYDIHHCALSAMLEKEFGTTKRRH